MRGKTTTDSCAMRLPAGHDGVSLQACASFAFAVMMSKWACTNRISMAAQAFEDLDRLHTEAFAP